ncbi:calcium-binding EGF-like domain-containing protein [Flavobacterium sangjuense]|uniref:EGF-like domain-containing protein n=1 Tax=Flavobacterium sangjuense TaxID=2518177 RepID=A0A4P7PV37_9FLAO|nr:calcium-binding EGF-like domain-containing protein [Flavobacterium sangjuense]QBZ98857.1 hypothetical protein GS03_02369 [Flavobacterium sangjuense]
MLIMIAAVLSCSSDSSSSCVPITCLNGGISNTNCGCDCLPGYSGNDCSTRITPTKIKVSKIRISMFPNTDSGGSAWDVSSGSPDISLIVSRDNSGTPIAIWNAPTYYPDVLSNGTNFFDFTLTIPIEITQVTTPHYIELLDYDGADTIPSANDTMGVIAFYPYVQANGFPTTIYLANDLLPLRFELTLSYEW